MKRPSRTAIAVATASVLALTLGILPAVAQRRDVVADAGVICAAAPSDNALVGTCNLLAATPEVDERNRDSLQRKAASAVLSLDDFYARSKERQLDSAIGSLCDYAAKVEDLVADGKLPAGTNLGEGALAIVDELGGQCG